MLTDSERISKRTAGFSIFCGIWNIVVDLLFCYFFVFSSFDMGENGYAKVGQLYKEIAHNISWIAMCLCAIAIISCVLLIVGGVKLLNSKNTRVSMVGLLGIYFYFLCFKWSIKSLRTKRVYNSDDN